jgi:PPOX class probable F420-dependent enzyme
MQLSDKARVFLEGKHFAVLATIAASGVPQQTMMWYELQGDQFLMNTTKGRKKETFLERDNRVSVCIGEGYNYITIVGTVELNYDQEVAQADIKRLAIRYRGEVEGNRQAEQRYSKQERVTLRLTIERIVEYFES